MAMYFSKKREVIRVENLLNFDDCAAEISSYGNRFGGSMRAKAVRKKTGYPAGLTVLSLIFAITFSTAASARVFFDIEGNYITVFGYTFCFSDCSYKSSAVELPRQPVVQDPLPK